MAGVAAFAAPILLACVPLAFPAPFVRAMVDERECSVESLSASLDTTNGWEYRVRASGVRWRDSDGSDVFIECCDARMGIGQNVAALVGYLRGKSSRLSGSCGSLVVRGVRGTMVINKDEEPTPIHSVPAPVATAIIAALRVEDVCLQVRAKRTVTREDSIVDPGAQAAGITCTLESADARDVWLHRAALDVLFGGSTAATGACLGGSVQLVPRAGAQHAEWRINKLHLQPSQLSAAGFVDETLVRAAVTATCDVPCTCGGLRYVVGAAVPAAAFLARYSRRGCSGKCVDRGRCSNESKQRQRGQQAWYRPGAGAVGGPERECRACRCGDAANRGGGRG